MPASKPTAMVIVINAPKELFIFDPAFTIRANMPITIESAAVAPANFLVSIKLRIATAPAITPIAIAIAVIVPLQSLASFVARIINAITAPSILTATMPLARFSSFIIPNTIAIAARIPIATDIANNVSAILGASFPTILTTAMRADIIAVRPIRPTAALPISLHSIPAIIFPMPVRISIAPDIANKVEPSLSSPLPGIMVIAVKRPMIIIIPPIPTAALPISLHSIPAMSFATPIINNMATES